MQIKRRPTTRRGLWAAGRSSSSGKLMAVAAALGAVVTWILLTMMRQFMLNHSNYYAPISSLDPLFGDRLIPAPAPSTTTSNLLRSRTTTSFELDESFPKVVWLLSFPNSGTSFTLRYVRRATNTSTATNYGMEVAVEGHDSIPIHPSLSTQGPWVHWNPDHPTKGLPRKYVLTKTHCSGFCSVCSHPDRYLETPRSFRYSCQEGSKAIYNVDGGGDQKGGKFHRSESVYDKALVKKAIHLFRHPLDNIVARFHLLYNREANKGEESTFTTDFPNTADGFHAWCRSHDQETQAYIDHPWLSKTLDGVTSLDNFDCHQEFLQYVQWHNNAFATIRELDIPALVIFYEDYSQNLDLAGERILTFLEADMNKNDDDGSSDEAEFTSGKTYLDFYTDKQKAAIQQFLFELASEDTWEYLRRYF